MFWCLSKLRHLNQSFSKIEWKRSFSNNEHGILQRVMLPFIYLSLIFIVETRGYTFDYVELATNYGKVSELTV